MEWRNEGEAESSLRASSALTLSYLLIPSPFSYHTGSYLRIHLGLSHTWVPSGLPGPDPERTLRFAEREEAQVCAIWSSGPWAHSLQGRLTGVLPSWHRKPWERHSTGILTPPQACEFGILTPIGMVTKTAQRSDTPKVTQPEGGRVGSIQPQLPGLPSVPML